MRIRRALTLLSFVATGLLATFSLAVGGAAGVSPVSGGATLTFVQGIHDSGPLDVWVNGVLTLPGLTYGTVTPLNVPSGSYNIAVRQAPSTQSEFPYFPVSTVNLSAGENATMVFNENNSALHVQNTYTNSTATTPAGQATVIVANTAQLGAVDVYAGNSKVMSDLAYPNQDSVSLPAGNVQLSIVANGSSGPNSSLFSPVNLSLTAGHVYIVYAAGTEASNALTAVQSYTVGETYTASGYVMAGSDGAAYTFGGAAYVGSLPGLGIHVNDVVGVAETADGGGYWMVASDGGVFNFGDAGFFGSAGAIPLNKPIVGMAPTPDGRGYWLVASDGGIFSYGDAQFYGSTGAIHLNKPIVGIHASPDGNGYVMVASDGGIFNYGDATYAGSLPGLGVSVSNIVGIGGGTTGYTFFGSNGAVYSFGGAPYAGSLPGLGVNVNNVVGGAVS